MNFNTTFFMTSNNLYSAGNDIGGKALIGSLTSQNYTLNKVLLKHRLDFKNIKSISCGDLHTIIVFKNGDCYGFGKSDYGQLGEFTYGLEDPNSYLQYKKLGNFIRSAAAFGKTTLLLTYDDKIIIHGKNPFKDAYGKVKGDIYLKGITLDLEDFISKNAYIESFFERELIFRLENGIFYQLDYNQFTNLLYFNKIELPYEDYKKINYYDGDYLILDDGRLMCKNNYYEAFNNFIQDKNGYWHIKIMNPDTGEEEKIKKVSTNFILTKTHNLYGFGLGYEVFNQIPFESETDEYTGEYVTPTLLMGNVQDFHQDTYPEWSNSIYIINRNGTMYVGGENIEGHLGLGLYKDKQGVTCTTETVWLYLPHPLKNVVKMSNRFETETFHTRKDNKFFEMVLNKSGQSSFRFDMIYSKRAMMRKSYMPFAGERVTTMNGQSECIFDGTYKPRTFRSGPLFEGTRIKAVQFFGSSPLFEGRLIKNGESEQKFLCTIKNNHDQSHKYCLPRHCIECSISCTTGCTTHCSVSCSATCATCCTNLCTNVVAKSI